MNKFLIVFIVALATEINAQSPRTPRTATDLAADIYDNCLKDFDVSCVKPKALKWFHESLKTNEILLNDNLSLLRTSKIEKVRAEPTQRRALAAEEQIFEDIDNFLATYALQIKPLEFFQTEEARAFVPDFLLANPLTKGGLVPLAEHNVAAGRGFARKVLIPFLLGLKFKTFVLVPLALSLIALKTWKAMTLGLLSLVLSGALLIFKIAKPKIVNYEVVHYPHHVEHVDHVPHHHVVPHHIEHIVPHHVEHIVPHHLDHHVDHHAEHLEHAAPVWDSHPWSRSSQEPQDAQEMAYNAQRRR